MFRAWADVLSSRRVRYAFVLFGVISSVALVPLSLIGASYAISALADISRAPIGAIEVALMGIAGILGIAAAWVRILVPRHKFKASGLLRWLTAGALVPGIVVAGLWCLPIIDNPLELILWAAVAVFAMGVFLLGATIGETKNAL
jgi:hypothetical protein